MPRLKIFNEALVDHYCPEKAISAVINPRTWFGVKEFVHSFKQKKEFKKALIYAEMKLLPFIQKPEYRTRLKGEHLEKWIKELHRIAGKTVLSDWHAKSGEYITEPVFRWEKTTDFSVALRYIIDNLAHDKKKRNTFLERLFTEYGLQQVFPQWLEIIGLIENNEIKVSPKFLCKTDSKYSKILYTLAYARTKGLLTVSQNSAVDKTCKIVLPDDIPEKMRAYSANVVEGIIECNGQLDSVVQLAAKAFRDLTKIHPFPNANGRVSTIILNLILVGFSYPSIVLRTNQDREVEDTEYNRVVANMDEDLEPLIGYIKKKINQEQHEPNRGTVESTPAEDDKTYLLSDALFALVKEFRKKEKSLEEKPAHNNTSKMHTPKIDNQDNELLKYKLNRIGLRFGFKMMYFPAYVEYTEEEMATIKMGQLKL